jgi:hypothetical protein
VKAKLLLDAHVPSGVADVLRMMRRDIDVEHVSAWHEGAYINAPDDLLLEACWEDRRALVSKDRATLPGWISLRVADGKQHGGIVFYDLERFKAHQIGALANAIVAVLDQTGGNLVNRWITLR